MICLASNVRIIYFEYFSAVFERRWPGLWPVWGRGQGETTFRRIAGFSFFLLFSRELEKVLKTHAFLLSLDLAPPPPPSFLFLYKSLHLYSNVKLWTELNTQAVGARLIYSYRYFAPFCLQRFGGFFPPTVQWQIYCLPGASVKHYDL